MNPDRPRGDGLRNYRHELRTPLNAVVGYSAMLLEDLDERDDRHAAVLVVHQAGSVLLELVGAHLGPAVVDESDSLAVIERQREALLGQVRVPAHKIEAACERLQSVSGEDSTFAQDVEKIRRAIDEFVAQLELPILSERLWPKEVTPGFREPAAGGFASGTGRLAGPDDATASASNEFADSVDHPREEGAEAEAQPGSGFLLVVDDNETNRDVLGRHLHRQGHRVALAKNGHEALELLERASFDLVLLDLLMPGMNGDEVLEQMKAEPELRDTPVVMISASDELDNVTRCISLGADDYLSKPFNPVLLKARIEAGLAKKRLRDRDREYLHDVETQVRERTRELAKAQLEIVTRLAVAAEYRDDDTGEHTKRVGRNAAAIARMLGWPAGDVDVLYTASRLHDVGKIGISDSLLLKPGKLSTEEFELMRTHTTIGARILSGGRSRVLRLAEEIALAHHERWDGEGYPAGLAGDAIPMPARIVSVADVLDALIHQRPYKPAWPVSEALAEIRRQASRQFDPNVAAACLEVFESPGALSPLETVGADSFEDKPVDAASLI